MGWLAFIVNQKWKKKIYKLGLETKDKKKPRYESRKMLLNQAQD